MLLLHYEVVHHKPSGKVIVITFLVTYIPFYFKKRSENAYLQSKIDTVNYSDSVVKPNFLLR